MANPILSEKTFKNFEEFDTVYTEPMTLQGTVNKSFITFILLVSSAAFSWVYLPAIAGENIFVWLLGAALLGFFTVLATSFKKEWAPYTTPVYAIVEGIFVGLISKIYEMAYSGIVIQSVTGTFIAFGLMLVLYKTGIIKTFKSVVIGATLAIGSYYLVSFVLSLVFHIQLFHAGNSLLSIGFSAFVIIIATLNFALDFDAIDNGVQNQAPKYMEWYSVLGLIVTIVWLYLEILRILSKLRSR